MATKKPLIYWDSCIFISWLMNEKRANAEESQGVEEIVKAVQKQTANMITSALTQTEVLQCFLDDEAKNRLDATMRRSNVERISTDQRIWMLAHNLRDFYQKKKEETGLPTLSVPDAVHLATAINRNVDVFYTFDERDDKSKRGIVPLNGDVAGHPLKIEKPFGQPNLFTAVNVGEEAEEEDQDDE